MTVVQPNSIAGINSITVQSGNSLAIHKSDGTLIREVVASTGISTYSSISVGSATTTNSANKSINIGLGASISQHADNTLSFGTNGDERARIDASGNFGVNENNPAAYGAFVAKGTGNIVSLNASSGAGSLSFFENSTGRFYLKTLNGSDGLAFVDADGSSERMRIDSSGRVGIGTVPVGSEGTELAIRSSDGQTNVGLIPNTNSELSELTFYNAANDSAQGYIKYDNDDDSLQVRVNLAERLRITSAGDVGISTVAPASKLHLYDAASDGLIVQSPSGLHYVWAIQSAGNLMNGSTAGDLGIRAQSGISVSANNGSGTQLRVDSSGRLLVNTTTSRSCAAGDHKIQVENTSTEGISLTRTTADAGGINISFIKTRNGSVVQSGDDCGAINWFGDDGTDTNSYIARIQGAVDGTPGSNDMPGRLVFSTTSDGGHTTNERMRIDSTGKIGINESSPAVYGIHASWSGESVYWRADSGSVDSIYGSATALGIGVCGTISNSSFALYSNNTERARINTVGHIGIKTTGSLNGALLAIGVGQGSNITSGEHIKIAPSASTITFLDSASNDNDTGDIQLWNTVYNNCSAKIQLYHPAGNTGAIKFWTHSGSGLVDRMRIRNDGFVLMQATSSDYNDTENTGFTYRVHSTSPYIRIKHTGSDGNYANHTLVHFIGSTSMIGEIKQDGDGTITYATSSDYRLKENVVDLTGAITRLKNLKPKRFNFKLNSGLTKDGFLAHELQEVVPESVNGTKDEVVTADSKVNNPALEDREIGDPVYQTADASRVVPLLTAALQEAITKIETLETKVAALESS